MTSVIEQCQVAPPPGSAAELTLPLTYFDHMWFAFGHMRRILFYKLPISKPDFVRTIIPTLKDSLSLALKHYIPLSGNVACPLNSDGYPELRYVVGDSISVTFSETDMDFNYLISNHPRDAKDFYPFIPQLAEPKHAPGVQLALVLAIQVTLFPNLGISIGFSNYHVACDGNTIGLVIKDPHEQGPAIWDEMKQNMLEMRDIIVTPLDKVRVTSAYVWTCLIKSTLAIGEEIDENVMEIFGCVADCRSRLNPPLPQSYFGNCLVTLGTKASRVDLVGKEGFTIAAEVIGETIQKQMKDEELILNCDWYREFCAIDRNRMLVVAGSPKFNLYVVDFGWGRPEKLEFISIDSDNGISMSLSKYKDSDGDLEVGLSLPKIRMGAFASIFTHGLSFL